MKTNVLEQRTRVIEDLSGQVTLQPPKSTLCTSKGTPKSLLETRGLSRSPIPHQETRFKDLLRAMHDTIPASTWRYQEREPRNFVLIDPPQLSPLPRLRQAVLRDNISKKISWIGTTQRMTNGAPPFLVNGSRPPMFPPSRQQTLIVKSLRQSKEKPRVSFNNMIKRSTIQFKPAHKSTDLNLPVLSPPFQTKSDKKTEALRLDFV
nr:PREDICTED: uncharacterized protein LOC106703300 [Latimeria chalumnae]|eukprot:XP_014343354.1 PREDICTED: uncharacterized protein LOC106703300 [Latimeria chalumnae]